MLKWALIFFVAALLLGLLGFGGLAGAAMGVAKLLFWAAIIIAVVFLVLSFTAARKIS